MSLASSSLEIPDGPRPRNHAWISWLAEATHGIHGWLAAGWLARLADSPGADSPDEGDADSRGQMRIRPGRCGFARADAGPPDEVPMSRTRFFKVQRSQVRSLEHGLI